MPGPNRRRAPERTCPRAGMEAMLPALCGEIPLFPPRRRVPSDSIRSNRAVRRKHRAVIAGGRDAARLFTTVRPRTGFPSPTNIVFTLPPRDIDPYDVHSQPPPFCNRRGSKVPLREVENLRGVQHPEPSGYAAAQAKAASDFHAKRRRGLTLYPAQIPGL